MVAPTGNDRSLTIPTRYTVRLPDFGFADGDGNAFLQVRIASLPTTGTLFYDSNGSNGGGRTAVTIGQLITATDIRQGQLTFVSSGTSVSSFTFQVQDNGGAPNLDASPNTLTFTPVASAAVNTLFGASISLSGLAAANGFKLQGEAPAVGGSAISTGGSVANAGDINGDGFADLIVGAFGFSTSEPTRFTGAAYVVYGKATGFGPVDLASLNASTGFRIVGEAAYGQAGASVASAGDVNGDGFADIIVSAPGIGNGAAYVVFGGASGTSVTNFGTLGSGGFRINGESASSFNRSGAVASGDFNGDGFSDIIVAAGFQGSGREGAAYVVYGKASGFGTVNLASLGAAGIKISGEASNNYLGRSVSAGDVNGDGFSDIIVGAYGNTSSGRTMNGAAYVIFGSSAGLTSLNVSTLTPTTGFKIIGEIGQDYAGWSVSGTGDVNGDGFADIIVGMNDQYRGASAHNGAAYVVFGKASGFGTVDLAALTATTGFKISGAAAGDYAGLAVSSAGDVNGDGFADILVGQPTRNGTSGVSSAYLLFGKATGFGPVNLATLTATQGVRLTGEAAGDRAGVSVSAAGDVNGDGFADLIVGALGNDSGGANAGAAYVIFGRSNVANTAPTISANTGSTVAEGGTDTVTAAELTASDSEQAAAALTFTITTAATNGTLRLNGNALALNGTFTQADVNGGLVTYLHNGGETSSASFGFSVSDGAGGTLTGQTFSFTVTPVDDAPVAVANVGAVNENATLNLDVVANDTDIDGGPKAVASINGTAATVGNAIALSSGATVTLQANGTLTYNPNGAFNSLVSAATGAATGATNTSATDSFTYALNGGSSASVTITVNGVDGAGDRLNGTGGNNTLTGTGAADFFDLSQGGNDSVSGGEGNDSFYFGGAFTGADSVNGGTGTNDQLGLEGNYSGGNALTLGAAQVTGIEAIALLGNNAYSITTIDDLVGAGQELTIYAGAQTGGSFSFNGSAETNGSFRIYGGAGIENIATGAGNDSIYFGPGTFTTGGTTITAGGGNNDQVALDGDYTVTLTSQHLTGVEVLALLRGTTADLADYAITFADSVATTGQTFTVYAVPVETASVINASAETDAAYRVFGGTGADTITGGGGADWLWGNTGDDILDGGGGNDMLIGDTGRDTLRGGNGDDVIAITVSAFNAENDTIDGGAGNDTLQITGTAASQTIADVGFHMRIAAGSIEQVTLIGGPGNTAFDYIAGFFTETAGVRIITLGVGTNGSSVSVANFSIAGATINGGAGNDSLTGSTFADVLIGGGGDDILRGGGGADRFRFTGATGAGNVDTIADFTTVQGDKIELAGGAFGLAGGSLSASAFVVGTAATTTDHRIIYNSATGALFYDADGNGAGAAVQFATLTGTPALAATDFVIV